MKGRIAFVTLGCKLNYAETATYERGFTANGYTAVPWTETADVYLINTCSVTSLSDRKSRNIIRKLHKQTPDASIIVTGCYAELKKAEVEAIEGVSLVFGAKEKTGLVAKSLEYLEAKAAASGINAVESGKAIQEETSSLLKEKELACMVAFSAGEERTRAFLKVQDGCNNFCAYCTVPFARGRSRNVTIAEAVKAAENIAASGVKEVVLTGVNTGDFGRTTGETFLDLIKALNAVDGIERYRISSIEPNLLTEEIVDWIASGTKFQPHFHIPLQSGSDALLKDVGRHYDTMQFEQKIEYVRSRMETSPSSPKVFFGIDVIVGLPGETDELFMETYRFLERIRPAYIHIFPYSKRPGTRSFLRKDQVQDSVKTERVKRLEKLCDRLHSEFVEASRGMTGKVLFEGSEHDGMMSGYTGNYIRVSRPFDKDLVGKIVDITL